MLDTGGVEPDRIIPKPCDFTTGGGYVINNAGAHANFGLVAGCKHHHFFGHVNFIDHNIELHVSSLTIIGYTEIHSGTNRRDRPKQICMEKLAIT